MKNNDLYTYKEDNGIVTLLSPTGNKRVFDGEVAGYIFEYLDDLKKAFEKDKNKEDLRLLYSSAEEAQSAYISNYF